MLIPKRVLLNISSRLRTYSNEKLESMLKHQQSNLENLKQTASKDTYEYLSFSIEQKITLIQNELNKREQTITQ